MDTSKTESQITALAFITKVIFAVSSGCILGGMLYITTLTHYTRQAYNYLSGITVAFIGYFIILTILKRLNQPYHLWILVGLAILCRVVLWVDSPTLSTDVWRYIWDGRLINTGINPYMYRVDAPELDHLRTPLSAKIEHTHMATPYPPAAQIIFSSIVAISSENPLAMQIAFTAFDLGNGLLIALLLKQLKRPARQSLLYLLNPLIIVEFAHGAHIDAAMTFFVLLALLTYAQQQKSLSSIGLAGAVLIKYIPLLLVPVFLRYWKWRATLVFGLVVLLGFLPFLNAGLGVGAQDDGSGILGAVRIYTNSWKTNDGVFYWLTEQLKPYTNNPTRTARNITTLILLMLGGYVWLRSSAMLNLARAIEHSTMLISTYLLLSAAVFPWYLTWLIALLPLIKINNFRNMLFIAGWLYFSWAIQISYLIYIDPLNPREEMWMRYIEYGPLLATQIGALLFWICEQQSIIIVLRDIGSRIFVYRS